MLNDLDTLETARLVLRPLNAYDFDDLYAMFNDPEVMRFYPGLKDQSLTQAWIDWNFDMYSRYGHGLYAIERKEDGAFLGQSGLIMQTVEDELLPEIGYLLVSSGWGKGYATEASLAWRERAFDMFRYRKIISIIRPDNLPSAAVAKRIGMQRERTIRKWEREVDVYALSMTDRPSPSRGPGAPQPA